MNNFYLMIVEFVRNQMFFSIMFCFLLFVFLLAYTINEPKHLKRFATVFGLFGIIIAVVITSFNQATLPIYSCFLKVENFQGDNPNDSIKELEKILTNHQKSMVLAKQVKAQNYPQLEETESELQNKIETYKRRLVKYNQYPLKTEYMVLGKIEDSYTIISEDRRVETEFSLNAKSKAYEDDYKFSKDCSMKITSVAKEKGFLVKN